MMRAVLDSNIHVSVLLFGGNPKQAPDLGVGGSVELCISDSISSEVVRVLAINFHWYKEWLGNATGYLRPLARWLRPQRMANDCVDPDDNHALECALEAQARCIVMGDHHLRVLHPYHGIDILVSRQFLESKIWETAPLPMR